MRALVMAAVMVFTGGCAASMGGPSQTDTGGPPVVTGGPSQVSTGGPSQVGTGESAQVPQASVSAGPVKTGETCNGTELLMPADGFPEVRGSSADAELWGLPFAELPFEAGAEVKIVWRMTGEGPLEASATGPGGKRAKLVWMDAHDGSSWRRPGDEWGTGWVFPEPGCWKVELSRTRGSGHAWLRVG